MAKLDQMDLELLDFLCAAKHARCRVKSVKASRRASLRRLRYAGLAAFESFDPSPSAMADWLERKKIDRILEEIQTPAPKRIPEPADSPEPKAREEGGAAARMVAAPPDPKRKPARSMRDRAARFEAKRKPVTADPPRRQRKAAGDVPAPRLVSQLVTGAELAAEIDRFLAGETGKGLSQTRLSWWLFKSPSGLSKLRGRKWCSDEIVARVRAFLAEPDPAAWSASYYKSRQAKPDANPPAKIIPQIIPESRAPLGDRRFREFRHERDPQPDPIPETAAEICEELCEPAEAPAAEPLEAEAPAFEISQTEPAAIPETAADNAEPMQERRRMDLRNAKMVRATRQRNERIAQDRIDAGKQAGKAASVHVRSAQMDLERRIREEARLACPIEAAKRILAKRHAPVCGAEVVEGDAGKGFFIVGRQRVTQAELLKMAKRIAA